MNQLEAAVERIYEIPSRHPLGWPLVMALVGASAAAAALIVSPGGDEWSYIFGARFGGPCGFQEATNLPCPSCGMTRSWVWLVRGDIVRAFTYNAAGALLLMGLMLMGALGALRVAFRKPDLMKIPIRVVSTVVIVWMLGPYLSLWFARMAGFNVLP